MLDVAPIVAPRPELETLSAYWQRALDAAEVALHAGTGSVPDAELRERRRSLLRERQETGRLLDDVARLERRQPKPWLSPVPVKSALLGLPTDVTACIIDVEGVLTDSARLHAWAWGEVFDGFLLRLAERTGWHFIPFDRVADYREYIDGRSRLEGVHAFLRSRGIRLPEGQSDDPPVADTANGLANRKSAMLTRGLAERGVTALPGARRYLEAAHRAGITCVAISASANTSSVLELAGLEGVVDERVDAGVMQAEGLRSRPAPDMLLAACRRAGVSPAQAATLTRSPAGVAAGHSAGLVVIGVGRGEQAELLSGFGAEHVVPSLSELLDPRLRDTEST